MPLDELVIAPKNTDGKGRAFRAVHVSAVMADVLTDLGTGDKHDRPIFALFAASDSELRPFVANLSCGRPAIATSHTSYRRGKQGYEFLKSAGYKVSWQRHDEGTIATVYLPDLVALDPGMVDPKGVKFVVIPGVDYLAEQARKMDVAGIVAYARHFKRTEEK